MICARCEGFMYDGYLAEANGIYSVKKCVNCGEMLDEVILSNRNRTRKNKGKSKPLRRKNHLRLVTSSGKK